MGKFEKIIKREDGTRIKFTCFLYTNEYRTPLHEYRVYAMKALPRKRSWISAKGCDYTPEEMYAAQMEYWESLKPQIRDVNK